MRYTNISDLYKQVQERKLTPNELEDREKIAKKLPMDDFKKRYGKDAMAVKMAVATNIAKGKSEETELDEAGSQGMFLVIQGLNDNKQKVVSMHKRKADAIKARDAWNDKNKPAKRTHKARVYEVGKFATTDGKPKTFKVGDNVMYSDFARSIVKEETELDENVEKDISKALGKTKHKVSKKGNKVIVSVSSNDEADAQRAMKNHPMYVAGKLRVVAEAVINEQLGLHNELIDHHKELASLMPKRPELYPKNHPKAGKVFQMITIKYAVDKKKMGPVSKDNKLTVAVNPKDFNDTKKALRRHPLNTANSLVIVKDSKIPHLGRADMKEQVSEARMGSYALVKKADDRVVAVGRLRDMRKERISMGRDKYDVYPARGSSPGDTFTTTTCPPVNEDTTMNKDLIDTVTKIMMGEKVDEGRMSDIDAMRKAGASVAEIAKELKLSVKDVKAILGEEVELDEMFGISSNSNHRAKTIKMLDGMGIKSKKDGRNGLIILGVAPKDQKGILDKIHKDIGMTNYRIMDEEVELDEVKTVRQLVDPKKEIMVVKKNKVMVIDKKDKEKYMKMGYGLAEKIAKEDNTNDKSDDGEGLDKVQPKAVKKKFKDRKDKDIDNDGDVDDSDKFLHKRRKAVSKAISKENYEIGKDHGKHTRDVTPGQSDNDFNKMVGVMQKKNSSMREALAKVWGMDEGKSPFQKEEKPLTKTLTGKEPTKVKLDPEIEEKKK